MSKRKGLILEVSSVCGARCIMCQHPPGGARKPAIMPEAMALQILREAHELGVREVHPQFWGEPSAAPEVVAAVTREARDLGMVVVYYTNGQDLPIVPPDKLIFSIDYWDEESCRLIRPGLDFNEVRANVRAYWDWACGMEPFRDVTIRATALPENRDNRRDIELEWGPYCHTLVFADESPAARPVEGWHVSPDYECTRPQDQIVVLSDGRVVSCCCDWRGEVVLGKFPDQTLEEIVNGQAAKDIQDRLARKEWLPICGRCGFRNRFKGKK